MGVSDGDRRRAKPMSPETVDRLAREYHSYSSQYPLFAEAPDVSDATIGEFLDVAAASTQIHDMALRADAAGTVQALTGLWQIFYREGAIAPADADRSLHEILSRFEKVKSERDVFDGGRAGVKTLLAATHSSPGSPQDRMIDLLAGTGAPNSTDTHTQLIEEMIRIFESQRLISLETIFDLSDNLHTPPNRDKPNTPLLT